MARGWNGQKRYIDVWPVDLQKPVETGLGWDNSSLFLLQLACILSMSSRWRYYARLRVFICVNSLQVRFFTGKVRELLGYAQAGETAETDAGYLTNQGGVHRGALGSRCLPLWAADDDGQVGDLFFLRIEIFQGVD